jgi:hypothetical protein
MSETSSTFVITKMICNRRTSGPAEPIDKIGPLFMTASKPQNVPLLALSVGRLFFLITAKTHYAMTLNRQAPLSLLPAPNNACDFCIGIGAQHRWLSNYRPVYEQLSL